MGSLLKNNPTVTVDMNLRHVPKEVKVMWCFWPPSAVRLFPPRVPSQAPTALGGSTAPGACSSGPCGDRAAQGWPGSRRRAGGAGIQHPTLLRPWVLRGGPVVLAAQLQVSLSLSLMWFVLCGFGSKQHLCSDSGPPSAPTPGLWGL